MTVWGKTPDWQIPRGRPGRIAKKRVRKRDESALRLIGVRPPKTWWGMRRAVMERLVVPIWAWALENEMMRASMIEKYQMLAEEPPE